jgi:hypothetical protein
MTALCLADKIESGRRGRRSSRTYRRLPGHNPRPNVRKRLGLAETLSGGWQPAYEFCQRKVPVVGDGSDPRDGSEAGVAPEIVAVPVGDLFKQIHLHPGVGGRCDEYGIRIFWFWRPRNALPGGAC